MTNENDQPVPAPPRESMVGVVTLGESPSSPLVAAPPAGSVPGGELPLPERPRLRVSFYYDGEQLRCELVLMTAQRKAVHREIFDVGAGSTFAQLHALLLSTTAVRAQHTAAVPAGAP